MNNKTYIIIIFLAVILLFFLDFVITSNLEM